MLILSTFSVLRFLHLDLQSLAPLYLSMQHIPSNWWVREVESSALLPEEWQTLRHDLCFRAPHGIRDQRSGWGQDVTWHRMLAWCVFFPACFSHSLSNFSLKNFLNKLLIHVPSPQVCSGKFNLRQQSSKLVKRCYFHRSRHSLTHLFRHILIIIYLLSSYLYARHCHRHCTAYKWWKSLPLWINRHISKSDRAKV